MGICILQENFESIACEWEALLPHTAANTIFVTPWWQQLWWERYGGDAELQILSVRRDDTLLGIAPLMISGDTLSFLGDTDLFDYHDFLVGRGCESDFYDAVWHYALRMDWHTLMLKSLRGDSDTLTHLPALAEQHGLRAEISDEDVSPFKALEPSWDEYLMSLRKKDRHELRRKLRRLENGASAKQYFVSDADAVAEAMPEFFRLMRASSPDKDGFLTAEREQFFGELAQELAERGQFNLFFLEVDNAPVASCICFDYADNFLLYNSGYDPAYSSLSVGLLNKALCIREAIESGRQCFDFLRGNERYKYNLGGADQTVHELVVRR